MNPKTTSIVLLVSIISVIGLVQTTNAQTKTVCDGNRCYQVPVQSSPKVLPKVIAPIRALRERIAPTVVVQAAPLIDLIEPVEATTPVSASAGCQCENCQCGFVASRPITEVVVYEAPVIFTEEVSGKQRQPVRRVARGFGSRACGFLRRLLSR